MKPLPISTFNAQRERILALLNEIVGLESPTTDKAAVDRLGRRLKQEAEALGASVSVQARATAGDNLVCRWNPTPAEGSGGLLILAHMDTVHDLGALAKWPEPSSAERLRGPGVLDMKAGIVLALEAVRALRAAGRMPRRPLTLLLNSDEETGSAGSRELIEAEARRAEMVFTLEPAMPDGSLKTWRKGVGEILLRTRGVASHAGGEHELGRNAIEELAHHILAAQRLTDYESGTTVNVGIVSGGTRSNVVPDQAEAQIDFRVLDKREVERLRAWADGLRPVIDGARVEARVELNRPPMPQDERMLATFEKARAIGLELGLALKASGTGGGSDANFVAPLGVAVLDGLGPQGDGAHSEREYIQIDSLFERAALLAALIENW